MQTVLGIIIRGQSAYPRVAQCHSASRSHLYPAVIAETVALEGCQRPVKVRLVEYAHFGPRRIRHAAVYPRPLRELYCTQSIYNLQITTAARIVSARRMREGSVQEYLRSCEWRSRVPVCYRWETCTCQRRRPRRGKAFL